MIILVRQLAEQQLKVIVHFHPAEVTFPMTAMFLRPLVIRPLLIHPTLLDLQLLVLAFPPHILRVLRVPTSLPHCLVPDTPTTVILITPPTP